MVGQIVHFVLDHGRSIGEHRPAIIVNTWGAKTVEELTHGVQLQVFTDNTNDFAMGEIGKSGMQWATSVPYSEEPKPYTWHWIEQA